ncbi:ribonuclease D [Thalassotalea sp. HSM 43]|uniref:ribonuclease D n=1 Tax=Thalassotalea sp. HSM 43 TaxID=2552945 RepID=UPI001675A86D|nr:ribonuclease D [Thalassotalea sp. HSM 43]
MQFSYISDENELVQYCQQASSKDLVCIDTEFVRTRTLFPNLGLLQIYDGEQLALIDPEAIADLSPFWQLLQNPDVLKVIHSCSEDLEVFLRAGQCRPVNMLDSQIAMAFLGHGLSMGYAAMIKHYLGLELDKSESRTDWLKRPLSQRQLEYAAADVYHLYQICDRVIDEINEAGFYQALMMESEWQIEKKFSPIDPLKLYLDNKSAWKLQPRNLAILQHLLAWRYEQAVRRNLPLTFVAKDATLFTLAYKNPKSVGAMANFEGIDILDIRHKGKAMLNVMRKVNELPDDELPKQMSRLDSYPNYKNTFKAVKQKLTELAAQNNLDIAVVAGKRQIHQLLTWHWQLNEQSEQSVELLQGWRGELFAQPVRDFLQSL